MLSASNEASDNVDVTSHFDINESLFLARDSCILVALNSSAVGFLAL